ncbi:MAG: AI-2E family transporter [Myxococcales bacterium]|nr:AI-2E family transporter [Myxococcales bacterium]
MILARVAGIHRVEFRRRVIGGAGTLVAGIGSVLSDTAFVLLTTAFIMAEAAGLPRKLEVALGRAGSMDRFDGIINDIQEYLSIKTKISLVTGGLAWILCLAVGVDYPVLWGVVAFFLNYIPTLGSIIAAVPPVLLGFVQFGWERSLAVLAGYVLINTVMGNMVEPKVMGKRLGLSSLVVFLSLVFWGWIWGPLGMFLSVPLTMVVKILLENSDDLKWIAVLLGSGAEMEERFDPSKSTVAMKVPEPPPAPEPEVVPVVPEPEVAVEPAAPEVTAEPEAAAEPDSDLP